MITKLGNEQIKWVKKELELSNMLDTKLGSAVVNLFTEINDMTDSESFQKDRLFEMINRLSKGFPLTELQESEMITSVNRDGTLLKRHSRYEWVQQDNKGKYYNRHAIAFIDKNGTKCFIFQNNYSSTKEITFPYAVTQEEVKLED